MFLPQTLEISDCESRDNGATTCRHRNRRLEVRVEDCIPSYGGRNESCRSAGDCCRDIRKSRQPECPGKRCDAQNDGQRKKCLKNWPHHWPEKSTFDETE